jgi:hypothetical protein
MWYLADPGWPEPNLTMLNNALAQTDWSGPALTADSWRSVVAERVDCLDWRRIVEDVTPLVESDQDLALLERETLTRLLAR